LNLAINQSRGSSVEIKRRDYQLSFKFVRDSSSLEGSRVLIMSAMQIGVEATQRRDGERERERGESQRKGFCLGLGV
jgi:hypothetical protein